MRIGIAGWFGSDNLGDELLLYSLLECVRSHEPAASFVVLSPGPARVTELHSVAAVHLPTLRGTGSAARREGASAAIRECDLLFLGPGTVFQERSPNLPWPGTLLLFGRIVVTARRVGTPVVPVGVGVREGGTAFGRRALRVLGAGCAAVGVRDERSAKYFGPKARVIGDLAYALPVPPPGAGAAEPIFALSMRPLGTEHESSLLAAVTEVVRRLVADGFAGDFLPMAFGRGAHGEDDRDVYHQSFEGRLGLAGSPLAGGRPLADTSNEWLARFAGYRLVVAARLHAALMAVMLGVPTVAIAYERKVRDAFVDLGLEHYVVAPDVDADALHRTATAAAAAVAEFRVAAARIAGRGTIAREFVGSVLNGRR